MFDQASREQVVRWVGELAHAPHTLGDVAARAATVTRIRDWAEAALAQVAIEAAALESRQGGPCFGATAFLQESAGLSAREARTVVKRAEVIAHAPVVGEALALGEVGTAHADALARTVGRASQSVRTDLLQQAESLLALGAEMTPEAFERHCEAALRTLEGDDGLREHERMRRESSFKQWVDRSTGMYCGRYQLDPVRGSALMNAVAKELDSLLREQARSTDRSDQSLVTELSAQALVNLVAHGHAERRNDPEVHVLIDHQSLITGLHPHGVCELSDGTAIPVATARRLACEAGLLPVVLGGAGEVLDVGRAERLATTAQRRALRSMYRSCAFPGCDVVVDRCEMHHVLPFEHGGATDLSNLVPVCWRHHHLIHEGGWRLLMDAQRTIAVVRPDGEIHARVPLPVTARGRRLSSHQASDHVDGDRHHHRTEHVRQQTMRQSSAA